MTAERLSDTELLEAMREQGIEDLSEVRVGIPEPDGKFSLLHEAGPPAGPGQALGVTAPPRRPLIFALSGAAERGKSREDEDHSGMGAQSSDANRSPSRSTLASTSSLVNTRSSAARQVSTSAQVTGVDTVGRSLARKE